MARATERWRWAPLGLGHSHSVDRRGWLFQTALLRLGSAYWHVFRRGLRHDHLCLRRRFGLKFRCDTTGLVSQYSGDLTGTAVADFTSLVNCKTGRETGHGTKTFTDSLTGGGSGTLSWIDQFSSDVDCSFAPDLFIPFNLAINSVAVRGSEGFAGLQGRLTFTDTTFSGTLH